MTGGSAFSDIKIKPVFFSSAILKTSSKLKIPKFLPSSSINLTFLNFAFCNRGSISSRK